jgi:hypothetical protein
MRYSPDAARQLTRALLVDVYGSTRPAPQRSGPLSGPLELRRAARRAVCCLDDASRSATPGPLDAARTALREVALLTRRCREQGSLDERPARIVLARQAAAAAALEELVGSDRGSADHRAG